MPPKSTEPATVFYSYSHKDERFRDVLATHLALLRRQGVISEWHDRRIAAGYLWEQSIDENIRSADIVLLLVSADFIASDYCWGNELVQAMERYDRGAVRIIPIILRPVDWSGAIFGKLQALPQNAKPITLWNNRDLAWVDIAKGIRAAVEALRKGPPAKPEVPSAPLRHAAEPMPSRPQRVRRSGARLARSIYTARNGSVLPGS